MSMNIIDEIKDKMLNNNDVDKNLIEKKIKEYDELSLEQKAKLEVDYLNSQQGTFLDLNCNVCNNKGYINKYTIDYENNKINYFVVDCDCKKIYSIYLKLEKCGINKRLLENYTFENFTTNQEWRKKLLDKVNDNYNNENDCWLLISGFTGIGKSHLCTALFKKEIVEKKYRGKYMLWKDDIIKLKAYKKSSNSENQDKYTHIMNEYKTADVLYIDDFLKLLSNQGYERDNDLDLAYEIINARYNNNLKTIISTEFSKEEMQNIDGAITGRIIEKAKKYWIDIIKDEKRNYRIYGDKQI